MRRRGPCCGDGVSRLPVGRGLVPGVWCLARRVDGVSRGGGLLPALAGAACPGWLSEMEAFSARCTGGKGLPDGRCRPPEGRGGARETVIWQSASGLHAKSKRWAAVRSRRHREHAVCESWRRVASGLSGFCVFASVLLAASKLPAFSKAAAPRAAFRRSRSDSTAMDFFKTVAPQRQRPDHF